MKVTTISSFRKRLKHYFNLVIESSEVLIVPEPGTDEGIVIISLKEYTALTETSYLLSSETNRNRLMESMLQAGGEERIL